MKLGIAPINWTNDDLPELGGEIPFEQCISEMALAGYRGCEIGVKFPKTAKQLLPYLKTRNLQVCNQWFGFELTTLPFATVKSKFLKHLKFLKQLGANIVGGAEIGKNIINQNKPILENRALFDEKNWKEVTTSLNKLGKIAADKGFKLCYHTHMGLGIQTISETEKLLNETDSDAVFLCYDCGHFYFNGDDHLLVLNKFKTRIGHVHLKDIRPNILKKVKQQKLSFLDAVKAGVFTVPSDGVIDFKPILKELKEINYQGWLVVEAEQDPAKANPYNYALTAFNFINKLL